MSSSKYLSSSALASSNACAYSIFLQSHPFKLAMNCTQVHSTCSPHIPYDALHLGCVSCVSIRNAHLWRATQRILYAGGQQSVWYLPEVLCQRAINRFKGHPPSPNSPTNPRPTCNHLHMGAPLRWRARWKGDGQSAMMLCLDEKSQRGESLCSFAAGDGAFISSSEFQELVQHTVGR